MIVCVVDNPVSGMVKGINMTADEEMALIELGSHMCWHSENYFFNPKYKKKMWDGRIRFFDARNGSLATGLLPYAFRFLKSKPGLDVRFVDKNDYFKEREVEIDADMFLNTEFGYSLYADQVFALKHILTMKRGLGELATGFGKSALACAMCMIVMRDDPSVRHCLVIVPTVDLVTQTYDSFVDMGADASMYYGSKKEALASIVVATWQSLQNNPAIMPAFGMIIVDEAHGAAAVEMQKLLNASLNARYRYGITGTLPKNRVNYETIRGVTGDVRVKIDANQLQERGRLTRCQIVKIGLDYTRQSKKDLREFVNEDKDVVAAATKELRANATRRARFRFVSGIEKRLELINKLAESGPSIIIVNNRFEGSRIEKAVPGSIYVNANTPTDERKIIYQRIRDNTLGCVIGTYKLVSTGLDIPNLKNVIFASPSKSFIQVIQSIGRILRLHDSKNMAYVYDIVDELVGIKAAWNYRKQYYDEKKYPIKEICLDGF